MKREEWSLVSSDGIVNWNALGLWSSAVILTGFAVIGIVFVVTFVGYVSTFR